MLHVSKEILTYSDDATDHSRLSNCLFLSLFIEELFRHIIDVVNFVKMAERLCQVASVHLLKSIRICVVLLKVTSSGCPALSDFVLGSQVGQTLDVRILVEVKHKNTDRQIHLVLVAYRVQLKGSLYEALVDKFRQVYSYTSFLDALVSRGTRRAVELNLVLNLLGTEDLDYFDLLLTLILILVLFLLLLLCVLEVAVAIELAFFAQSLG